MQVASPAPRLSNYLKPTTILAADQLSKHLGVNVLIASEIGQHTGSFKFRAAMNVVLGTDSQMFIAASSGNFAQALAYACSLLSRKCLVVMPSTSATVKIDATRSYGAQVELIDTNEKPRKQRLAELATQYPEAYIASPFDDPLVIAGNASLGMELGQSAHQFDAVIVPVGGGGLSSGVLLGLRQSGREQVQVYGAEPQLANDAYRSLVGGSLVANEKEPQTIADGARTLSLGEHNWPILRDGLAGIIEVPETSIMEAVRLLLQHVNIRPEPTGALSTGALLDQRSLFQGKTVVCIVSGGNVDESVLEGIVAGVARMPAK